MQRAAKHVVFAASVLGLAAGCGGDDSSTSASGGSSSGGTGADGGVNGGSWNGGGPSGGSGGSTNGGSGGSANGGSGGTAVQTYPAQRVGIFYLGWHAFAADAMAQVPAAERFTIEDVIRTPSLGFGDVIAKHGLLGQAASFHYHAKPAPGFYCLYRARPGEPAYAEPNYAPDCPNISAVAKQHAEQLWSAGVDFVFMDITNFAAESPQADVLGVRPFEVLLEEWAALRKQGIFTPQIAAWMPARAVDPGQTPLYPKILAAYAKPEYADLLLTHQPTQSKVMFLVDATGSDTKPEYLADIQAAGILPVKMWGNLAGNVLDSGVAGWMQPCTAAGAFTTLVPPNQPCAQGYAKTTPLGAVLSVSASFQIGYASLPFQASGRLGGLTLKKQFETAFAAQPNYLMVNAWNEHIAQPQPNPHSASLGALRRSMGKGQPPSGDAGADWLWVDMYGGDGSRDLEPTSNDAGANYELLKSCLRVYKSGHTSCTSADQSQETCCQLGQGRLLVRSLRGKNDGGSMNTDHVLTLSELERDTLVQSGGFAEVCSPFYGPPGLCGGGTTVDGPFLVFADAGPKRVAFYRCLTGVDHFISTASNCEGTTTEGPLGFLSTEQTSDTPRPLRRCYHTTAQRHFHSLTGECPSLPGVNAELTLGYVR